MRRAARRFAKGALLAPLRFSAMLEGAYSRFLNALDGNLGTLGNQLLLEKIEGATRRVSHRSTDGAAVEMEFFVPNRTCAFRAATFSSKEPEILEWIDRCGGDGAFFDVGANVGMYSIYHGMTKGGEVYAFEPSVFNLPVLSRNIGRNGLESKVRIVPNPLSDGNRVADFSLSSPGAGGSHSAFGVDYGHEGERLRKTASYRTVGFALDSLVENGLVSGAPGMMKIDVDGIEHLVLKGAERTLRGPALKTVYVEVNDNFREQAEGVAAVLQDCGFTREEKRRSETFDDTEYADTHNQIWMKA